MVLTEPCTASSTKAQMGLPGIHKQSAKMLRGDTSVPATLSYIPLVLMRPNLNGRVSGRIDGSHVEGEARSLHPHGVIGIVHAFVIPSPCGRVEEPGER